MTNHSTQQNDLSQVDEFYRDLLYKMMGFGLAVLIVYLGWMVGTGDKERFQWYSSVEEMKHEAEKIARRYGSKESSEYNIKLPEIEEYLQMKWDRTYMLFGMFVGTFVWFGAIVWAYCKINNRNHKTVPSKLIIFIYCFALFIPQLISDVLILKD